MQQRAGTSKTTTWWTLSGLCRAAKQAAATQLHLRRVVLPARALVSSFTENVSTVDKLSKSLTISVDIAAAHAMYVV